MFDDSENIRRLKTDLAALNMYVEELATAYGKTVAVIDEHGRQVAQTFKAYQDSDKALIEQDRVMIKWKDYHEEKIKALEASEKKLTDRIETLEAAVKKLKK